MVKEIKNASEIVDLVCKDVSDAEAHDIVMDLIETANTLQDKNCCGLSANQIGYPANVFIVRFYEKGDEEKTPVWLPIINPRVKGLSGKAYEAEEINFSLNAPVKAKRYPTIYINFVNMNGKQVSEAYSGEIAQIIQHELNMIRGVFSKK